MQHCNWAKNPQHVTLSLKNGIILCHIDSNPPDPMGVSAPLIATLLGPGFSGDPLMSSLSGRSYLSPNH